MWHRQPPSMEQHQGLQVVQHPATCSSSQGPVSSTSPKPARDSSARQAPHRSCSVSSTKLGNPKQRPTLLWQQAGGRDHVHLPCQNRNRAFRNGKGKGTDCGREKQRDSRKERHTIPARFRYAQRGACHLSSPRVTRSLTSATPGEGLPQYQLCPH